MKSEVFNIDCMEGMKNYPDKYFDLAIVDPPYGLGIAKKFGDVSGKMGKCAKKSTFTSKSWDDSIPDETYFNELFRVSKNQIIWGWNYFVPYLTSCQCYIVWNKHTNGNFADCESAYTSFKEPARVFDFTWNGMLQQDMKNKEVRVHPTQKPVQLYKWLMQNYAKPGDKILDTHLGSGSNRIAAFEMGYDFTAFELDAEYFHAQEKRYIDHTSQLNLFKAS